MQLAKTELLNAAEAAGRAACTGLDTDVATAQSMAVSTAAYNKADGVTVVIDSTNDIQFGTWDGSAQTFTVLSGSARTSANAVKVYARRTTARGNPIQMMFASVLGKRTCDVTGVSMVLRNRTCLFVVGQTGPLTSSDQNVYNRLVGLGFSVTAKSHSVCTAGDATGMALVVISETVDSTLITSMYRTVTVPVVVYEANLFDNMSMTGSTAGTNYDIASAYSTVTISSSSHPLAAGLSGTVTIYPDSGNEVNWGSPTSSAAKVAYTAGSSSKWGVFGYDTGASMSGGFSAPARRVGLPFRYMDTAHISSNGWKLFDAAIQWAVGDI